MATACANLKPGKTSNITGMNLLENIAHVMLQWGEKAQWFNHLTVRSVVGLEKSYLNVYSSLSAPIYFNSKVPLLSLIFRNTVLLAGCAEGGIWLT